MNTEKHLLDYLHLYIGCDMILEKSGRKIRLQSVNREDAEIYGDGKWWHLEYWLFKPILRRLEDIKTSEQAVIDDMYEDLLQIGISGDKGEDIRFELKVHAGITYYLLGQRFDLFGLIDAGLATPELLATTPPNKNI